MSDHNTTGNTIDMKQTLQEIAAELKAAKERDEQILHAVESGNMELIRKVDMIQAKLEEMARGQLLAIVEQGERLIRSMQETHDATEQLIHMQTLQETVETGKEQLGDLLPDAFPQEGSEEIRKLITEKFEEMEKGLEAIGKGIYTTNENVLALDRDVHKNMDNGFKAILTNGLNHFATLKELIQEADKGISDLNHTVSRIPTERGLY